VTREHLDYHETMEEYARAKERLFEMVSKNKNSVSVVNLNTEFADNFLKYLTDQIYGYAIKNPNDKIQMTNKIQNPNVKTIFAEEVGLEINYSKFKIQNSKFLLNLPGEFNIENALAATCVGLSQGIGLEKISAALAKIKGVPGRMEKISAQGGSASGGERYKDIDIIVDYAVTPDSLKKLYDYLDGIKKEGSKIIAVFGSCGERDRGKRPIMGEIVARHADYCFVTNEDPYRENPVRIINEVFSGVVGEKITSNIPNFQFSIFNFQTISNSQNSKLKTEGENAFRILDRKKAIKTALQIAKPGDIVVVTGMGAQETMAVGDKMIPWNDPKIIREVLRELASEKNR
jgi:UDP-N-acetylmuramoyl-L-alanyl-D-glutamate--2,6-diaminopimelate ligase